MFGGYTQEVIGTSVFGERFDSQTVPETNGAVSVVPPEAAPMDGSNPLAWSMYRAVATIFDNSSGTNDVYAVLTILCPFLRPLTQLLVECFPADTTLRVRRAM